MVVNDKSYQDILLGSYVQSGKTGNSSGRNAAFQAMLPYFGKADSVTLSFRERCRKLGFRVVLSQGMIQREVLSVLESYAHGKSERVF